MPVVQIGNDNFYEVLSKIRGPEAVAEWRRLQEVMRPLAKAAVLMPPVAFRCAGGQDRAGQKRANAAAAAAAACARSDTIYIQG